MSILKNTKDGVLSFQSDGLVEIIYDDNERIQMEEVLKEPVFLEITPDPHRSDSYVAELVFSKTNEKESITNVTRKDSSVCCYEGDFNDDKAILIIFSVNIVVIIKDSENRTKRILVLN